MILACDARRLLAKMLAIDPNERYSTAEALQDPYVKCWYREEEVQSINVDPFNALTLGECTSFLY